jgi:hypothetical protein
MNETVIVRPWYRNVLAGCCLILCGVLGFSLWTALAAANEPVAVGFALVIALLCVHLLFCRRHRLEVGRERIVSRGLLTATEVRLTEVTEVKWGDGGPGGVILTTNFDTLTILFVRYPRDASLHIVRLLREAFPASMQQGWELFCLKVALPLRNPATNVRRVEVVFSRAHFDRLAACLFFVEMAWAAAHWSLFGFPGDWMETLLPLAVTALVWIGVRYRVPVKPLTKTTWFPVPLIVDLLVDHIAWACCLLAIILICVAFLVPPGGLAITATVLVLATGAEMLRRSIKHWRKHKTDRQEDLKLSEAAIREWDLLDYQDSCGHGACGNHSASD